MLRVFGSFRAARVAPFTVFQPSGMLMACPVPLQVNDADPTAIAREGYIRLTLIPRESPEGPFSKDKKISVSLKPKQIGQLLAWKSGKFPLSLNAFNSTVDLAPKTGDQVEVTVSPKEGAAVTVTIDTGDLRSLQVLMEAALPHLYGWVGGSAFPRKYESAASTTPKSPEEFFNQFK